MSNSMTFLQIFYIQNHTRNQLCKKKKNCKILFNKKECVIKFCNFNGS